MDIIKTAAGLISFKTETGDFDTARKCLEYCRDLFKGTDAVVEIFQKQGIAPVIFIRNRNSEKFDALVLGHLDVVPAAEDMFTARIENGKMYGRGTLDMKSFAAVALNSMEYVLKNKLDITFGIILSTDEEKGSCGTHAFLDAHPDLSAKIVLDNDVGGDIYKIINKCKNPVFVKINAKGLEAHGSTPWEGIDANQKMFEVLGRLREIYPYYSKDGIVPEDMWVDTVHVAKITGGDVSNIIANHCEALLDFRLTENSTVENLRRNLDKCMVDGVTYTIVSESVPVVMREDNPAIQDYKHFAEEILQRPIEFEQIGGATDARLFAVKGSTVIMHSGSGEGMHAANEYVEIDSVLKLAEIQVKFLEKLALAK